MIILTYVSNKDIKHGCSVGGTCHNLAEGRVNVEEQLDVKVVFIPSTYKG